MKEKVKVWAFVILLLIFIVGGYVFMRYAIKVKPNSNNKKEDIKEIMDYRIDKSKDYIYYENVNSLIPEEDINSSNIVINLINFNDLNNQLNEENNTLNNNIKYVKDMNLDENKKIKENEKGIYSINYREYENNTFNNYINLIVKDYKYDVENGIIPIDIKSYIIDKDTNKLLTKEKILEIFNTDWDTIQNKIKERLQNTQILVEGENVINIDETLKGLDKCSLTVSKNGNLKASFIVQSEKNIYNDNIELV